MKLHGNKLKRFIAMWKQIKLLNGKKKKKKKKKKLGALTKYYVVNTLVDPIHCCFKYIRIIYNKEKIVYHI